MTTGQRILGLRYSRSRCSAPCRCPNGMRAAAWVASVLSPVPAPCRQGRQGVPGRLVGIVGTSGHGEQRRRPVWACGMAGRSWRRTPPGAQLIGRLLRPGHAPYGWAHVLDRRRRRVMPRDRSDATRTSAASARARQELEAGKDSAPSAWRSDRRPGPSADRTVAWRRSAAPTAIEMPARRAGQPSRRRPRRCAPPSMPLAPVRLSHHGPSAPSALGQHARSRPPPAADRDLHRRSGVPEQRRPPRRPPTVRRISLWSPVRIA